MTKTKTKTDPKSWFAPPMKRDWTPVLRNGIYCSPACGGSCTKADFDKATREAKKLAKKLGGDWKPEVWENLGWHWNVINGEVRMSLRRDGYNCFTYQSPQYWGTGETPEEAIDAALRQAAATTHRAEEIENELRNATLKVRTK